MTTQYAAIPILRAVNPAPPPEAATLDDPTLYFNKELGWVDFHWRALVLAKGARPDFDIAADISPSGVYSNRPRAAGPKGQEQSRPSE